MVLLLLINTCTCFLASPSQMEEDVFFSGKTSKFGRNSFDKVKSFFHRKEEVFRERLSLLPVRSKNLWLRRRFDVYSEDVLASTKQGRVQGGISRVLSGRGSSANLVLKC